MPRPFHDAVKAGTGAIMCSYNRVNNSYGCQNSKTQNGLLKGELGFRVRISPRHSLMASLTNDLYLGFRSFRLGCSNVGCSKCPGRSGRRYAKRYWKVGWKPDAGCGQWLSP